MAIYRQPLHWKAHRTTDYLLLNRRGNDSNPKMIADTKSSSPPGYTTESGGDRPTSGSGHIGRVLE
jgi:hypothetical protein